MAENETNNEALLVELTNTSLEAANISKLNFEAGYEVEITETNTLPIVTLEYAGGLKDVPHNMKYAPTQDSLATKRAVLDILGEIDLQQLCVNLEATAALVDIAYNACNSIVGAHQKLYKLRNDIYMTTTDSVSLANKFSYASKGILENLVDVYKSIASGDSMKLIRVGKTLSRISGLANGMSEEAQTMADDFNKLSSRTLEQGSAVVAVENDNMKLKEDMEKQLQEFKVKLAAFHASKKEIENQIEEAQNLYTKYDKEAKELNEKADKAELVGMIVGGIGAIVGSVATAFSGFTNVGAKPSDTDDKKAGNDKSETDGEEKEKLPVLEQSEDVKERQSRLGSNQAELEVIDGRLAQYEQQIADLEKEKPSDDEKRTDEKIDQEIDEIKEKRDADSKRKTELTKQISEDNAYLKAKMASQVGMSVEDASKKFGEKFDNSSANARSAAVAKEKLAEEILKLKFELQKKNVENESMIAEFTRKIKNMNLNTVDLSVAITSLQLAVTCLSTVGSILANVAVFWKRVELSLQNLVSNITLVSLPDMLQASKDNPEKLAVYVKTDEDFLGDWYIMESKWFALQIICEAYHKSCENAKGRLDTSLRRAETDGLEHWKLAQAMAAEMEEKLKINLRSSESKTADYKKKLEIMEKSRENSYRELLEEEV